MEIKFTIPDKYIERIKKAFDNKPKEKIIELVKEIVRIHEANEAKENMIIEEDLIS